MVRWLPLGEITAPELGLIIQGVGVAAMLFAILAILIRVQLKQLPAYTAIISTGLFATALGVGLADPAAWNRYGNLVPLFIISLGFGLAVGLILPALHRVTLLLMPSQQHSSAILSSPRKTLKYETTAERFNACVASTG